MNSATDNSTVAQEVEQYSNWQRRWHPLLSQWVLISARSAARPWSGAKAESTSSPLAEHDPGCYLCPGVTRANGTTNPHYQGAFAFDNDFPSLALDAPQTSTTENNHPWKQMEAATGVCRVLCWSERHNATLADLDESQMKQAVELWQSEYAALSQLDSIANVLIFENKGVEIGVSNLHPHGQVYASSFVTDTALRMRNAQIEYAKSDGGNSLILSILNDAHTQDSLLVEQAEYFSVIVPYCARFAYETWIVPHRHVNSVADMKPAEIAELAYLYQRQVRRYDLLFMRSAPNITLLHNAPCHSSEADLNKHWCFHLAFHPPLREPGKLKFLAGFESGANNIVNPVQPEHAAHTLRSIDVEAWAA